MQTRPAIDYFKQAFTLCTALLLLLSPMLGWGKCYVRADQKVSTPEAFYNSLEKLNKHQLQQALNQYARKNHRPLSYSCIWKVLAQADKHPSKPKSIMAFYSQRPVLIKRKDHGQNDPDSWNREHIWPKSKHFKEREQWAHTDAHHIRAADKSVNADRANLDFGYPKRKYRKQHNECRNCWFDRNTWQAPKNIQGDIARMVFYMAVRYDGDKPSKTPNLRLTKKTSRNFQPLFGNLCDLLKWHQNDPVSQAEKNRNNIIQSWQGNRNPFIDRPELAQRLYASRCKKRRK